MKKFNKKDCLNILIITVLVLIYVILKTKGFQYVYGSTVDWDCQHWAIPEYFRNLFYSTGEILPNFAFNIGNGQNIFYLSYYGLLSPIILISYLLPFIKMVDYIQIISVLGIIISAILLYKWLCNKYTKKISLIATIFFIALAPLLFHSHRHIMFVNYMPFLILALMGVDNYFENNKKSLLILSIFLIIMTSYFFSVSAIFGIVIYGICVFFEKNKNVNIKMFFKEGFKFLLPIIVGVLMSAMIILPTFYIILKGRTDSSTTLDIISLIKPQLRIDKLFYSAYSIGLNALALVALVKNSLKGDKKNKLLSIFILAILLLPMFAYVLNGTLYIDYKVFATFAPLLSLILANFINKYSKENDNKSIIIALIIGLILYILNIKYQVSTLFLIDLLVITSLLLLGNKIQKKSIILLIAVITTSLASLSNTFETDKLYQKEYLIKMEESTEQDVFPSIFKEDDNVYRITNQNYKLQNINRIPTTDYYISNIYSSTSNNYYKDYFYNHSGSEITERSYGKISSSMNIFYNLYNANKYFIADEYIPIGYKNVKDNLYVNEDVLPIIYASSNLMSKKDYEKLEFPYNMEAMLTNIIVDDDSIQSNYKTKIEEFVGNVVVKEKEESLELKKVDNGYVVNSKKESKLKLSVSNIKENEILIVKLNVENNKKCPGDLSITVNGIENVLTCKSWKYHNQNLEFHYVISSNEILSELDIIFSKGTFNISNIKLYKVNYNDLKTVRNSVDEFKFDNKYNTDNITGKINVTNDGYLYMSIPYDEGFKIYLNDKEYKYEKVDNSFIGIKVEKGEYEVAIKYNSPLLKEGLVISSIGFIAFLVIFSKERKKVKKILDLK